MHSSLTTRLQHYLTLLDSLCFDKIGCFINTGLHDIYIIPDTWLSMIFFVFSYLGKGTPNSKMSIVWTRSWNHLWYIPLWPSSSAGKPYLHCLSFCVCFMWFSSAVLLPPFTIFFCSFITLWLQWPHVVRTVRSVVQMVALPDPTHVFGKDFW